jgi:phosphopantetheine--protein transferase-like protein
MNDSHRGGDIAITGMACVFPGAKNLESYWNNILRKVDAVSDPPPDWEADLFFDPDSELGDRTYCKRGGYLGSLAQFNPMDYGIMPNAVDGTEPDHFLALRAASEALADAGYADAGKLAPYKERTEVIIGRGTYVNRGNTTAIQHSVVLDSVLRVLEQLHPEHTKEDLAAIRRELKANLPPFHADTAPGLVPNIISGRIANRLDLMGPNYVVDAACASSLVAVDLAITDLLRGRCDMAIAGGVHASTPATILVIFSQLKALSRRGQIRPFDQHADGTLLGEGVGMLVLKRREDAERDGDRIYALIKGVGTASDGRALGLLAPRLEGEHLALRRAYDAAGVDPASVELIEAHGTATPVGDAVEVEALNLLFGPKPEGPPRCALGSVKSMISHTMPASGSAGLIKAALALHHRVLPPTLHCENPNPKLHLEASNFYLNSETRPWIHGSRTAPRRAGVNSFGFGGINAHAVLEEYTGPNPAPWLQREWDSELFVLTAPSRDALPREIQRLRAFIAKAPADLPLKDLAWTQNCCHEWDPCRLTIVASSLADLDEKMKNAEARLANSRTAKIRAIDGIYYFSDPLSPAGKLALVFPGEGAQYENMLGDLCVHFPEVREVFDLVDRAFAGHARGYLPSDTIFPPPSLSAGRLWSMDSGAEAVFAANQAMYALISKLNITPHAVVGHSTGEHSALLASGLVETRDEDELIRHIRGVNGVFESLKSSSEIPHAVLLAIAGCSHALLETLAARSEGSLHIALDNCPHQVVMCGSEEAIDACVRELAGQAAVCQKLPFSRAYHTPWFDIFSRPLRRYFETANIGVAKTPIYSCVSAERFPANPDAVRDLTSIGWARTVRFRETVEAMYRDGARIFVETGPRGNLTGFIDDTLRGKSYIAIPSNVQHRSGILQLHHLVAQLIAHHVPVDLNLLYARRAPQSVAEAQPAVKTSPVLSTGLRPVRLGENFRLPQRTQEPAPAPVAALDARQNVMDRHFQTMSQFLETQNRVMSSYLAGKKNASGARPPARASKGGGRPFITEVTDFTPGKSATALFRFSPGRELLFRDHTLGRDISKSDPSLTGLAVVPLTFTMEMLAECGELLEPGRVLVGMRDFRAYRWITLDSTDVSVELSARRREPGSVYVTLRAAGGDAVNRPLWAEGVMLYSDRYAEPRAAAPFRLEEKHASLWKPERLYIDGMFHGPAFQAVRNINLSGKNGVTAAMEAGPRTGFFSGIEAPEFLTEPVILDAAGQVVAFWAQEELDANGDIFPYSLGSLTCFSAPPAPGTKLECRVLVKHVDAREIHSDIEILNAEGELVYRLEGWNDRRFAQHRNFWKLRIAPRDAYLSEPWEEPLRGFLDPHHLACSRIDFLSREFFEASHGIWPRVLAHLILSRRERDQWISMAGSATDQRRRDWLIGRCAAKDAVRMLIHKHRGVRLHPAEVEIVADAHGRPCIEGDWMRQLNVSPVVSVAHSGGMAAALASLDPGQMVGIDIESIDHEPEDFRALAFSEQECALVDSMPESARREWSIRMWCAKEAVAKALGRGLSGGLRSLRIAEAERQNGTVQLELQGNLLQEFAQLRGKSMIANTSRGKDFVFSTIVYQPGTVQ